MTTPWRVETLYALVDAEIEALPPDLRARLVRIAALVEAVGFEGLPRETVKHLDGKLWELRVKATSGMSRAISVTVNGRRLVILHVFVETTQKTPSRELEIARQRAMDVE